MGPRRTRRSADEARRIILEAAEKRLVEGGPEAVRVQPVARDLGMTDAAIHHHFGSREQLMSQLLRFGGRRLRDALREAVDAGGDGAFDLRRFAAAATHVFADRGYARLALWLDAAGWRAAGSALFDEVPDGIAAARGLRAPDDDARQLAALIALVLMAEPIFGRAARRSTSLAGDAASQRRFREFVLDQLEALVARPAD